MQENSTVHHNDPGMTHVQERGSGIIFACFDCVDASRPSQCRAVEICVSTSWFRKALTCQHNTMPNLST